MKQQKIIAYRAKLLFGIGQTFTLTFTIKIRFLDFYLIERIVKINFPFLLHLLEQNFTFFKKVFFEY